MKKLFIAILFLLILLNSCSNLKYINKDYPVQKIIEKQYKTQSEPYRLQPYDYLYVSIKSTNKDINELYSQISTSSVNTNNNQSNFFLTGYLINDSGYVYIPTLGKIYVQGKTMDEVRKLIQQKVNNILNDAVVNVRLTSFNVSFLGEIQNQGKIPFYKERVNILEAIAKAGGIGYYGDKRHIKIIRPKDSTYVVYNLDLTNANILKEKEFYLYPNDIVYVPARHSKDFFNFIKNYSTFITLIASTITTTLLILQIVKTR
jgi:polysaccharide export outer membrane protein